MLFDNDVFTLSFKLNHQMRTVQVQPLKRLLDIIREDLKLTGTKEGCGEGECGACTVVINGKLACSCLIPAFQVQGESIETIESVAQGKTLSIVQNELARCGGTQCGMCTPGVVMACESLLKSNRNPSTHEIKEALAGNLCRCTGYTKIIEAVSKACEARTELG